MEFVNTQKLKGFIREEMNSRDKKILNEIDNLYEIINRLREEFILGRIKR